MEFKISPKYIFQINRFFKMVVAGLLIGSVVIFYNLYFALSLQTFLAILIFQIVVCTATALWLRKGLFAWNNSKIEILENDLLIVKQKGEIRIPFTMISNAKFFFNLGKPFVTKIKTEKLNFNIPPLENGTEFYEAVKAKINNSWKTEVINRMPLKGWFRTAQLTITWALFFFVGIRAVLIGMRLMDHHTAGSYGLILMGIMIQVGFGATIASHVLRNSKVGYGFVFIGGMFYLLGTVKELMALNFHNLAPWQYSLYFLYNVALLIGTLAAGLLLLKTPPDSTTLDLKGNA
jgi:hypothetical protein